MSWFSKKFKRGNVKPRPNITPKMEKEPKPMQDYGDFWKMTQGGYHPIPVKDYTLIPGLTREFISTGNGVLQMYGTVEFLHTQGEYGPAGVGVYVWINGELVWKTGSPNITAQMKYMSVPVFAMYPVKKGKDYKVEVVARGYLTEGALYTNQGDQGGIYVTRTEGVE